jgi:FkbM family methyltransferase
LPVTYQRLLLRASSLPLPFDAGRRLIERRVWRVEGGVGAGLALRLPQNREYITGTSEGPVQREIARLVHPGDVFYDIGANIGFFTLIAARLVGEAGCVCAFEPHPRNAAAVRDNAGLNGMAHVRVYEAAAGREARVEELLMTAWDGGGALAASPARPAAPVERTAVRVVPLDAFIRDERLPAPTFVKIDVEGVEEEVLEGMEETIARAKPALLYEVDGGEKADFDRRWAALDDWVAGRGYDVRRLESSYPNLKWHVGHSLALPHGGGRS